MAKRFRRSHEVDILIQELWFIRFTPFHLKTCNLQLYFIKILEISLLFCKKLQWRRSSSVRVISFWTFLNSFCPLLRVPPLLDLSQTGELEPGSEFGLGHRLPGGQHRSSRPEGGEAPPGAGAPMADHQDRPVCRHRAEPQRRSLIN